MKQRDEPVADKKPKKIYERIAADIKRWIEQGHVVPGEKLPDMRTLAARFGVSRATVREAFSSLVGMGLIELRHGEGTFVQKIDVETMVTQPMNAALLLGQSDMRQLLEVRKYLELGAVEAAARRADASSLTAAKQALEKMEEPSLHLEERVSADLQFHLGLAEAAGNPLLYNLLNSMSEAVRSRIRSQYEGQEAAAAGRQAAEHRLIYDAVLAGEPERAVRHMREHLESSERQS